MQVYTVDKNKAKCTIKEYFDAEFAQSLQDIRGQPSTKDHIK